MAAFKTFIVPYDFSDAATKTLAFASKWADACGGALIAVHGMQLPIVFSATPTYSDDDILQGLQSQLESRLRNTLSTEGFRGDVVVRREPVQEWINEIAAQHESPVVLLSRHGWSGHDKGLGTTARRIVQSVEVPVWLQASRPSPIKHVMVAIALDGKGLRLTEVAKKLADEQKADLRLVTVMDTISDVGYLSEVGWEATDRDLRHFTELAREELKGITEKLSTASGEKISSEVLVGGLTAALKREADDTDSGLVVCGKHTRSALATLFLGSTSESLARSMECHLLIVP